MRKIKAIILDGKNYIYINRGVNYYLFTQEELNIAKLRYKIDKRRILLQVNKNDRKKINS